jgi:hypothetical protein
METRFEPAPTDPAAGASARAQQVHFLTRLGHALSVAGDPVSATEQTLRDVAASYDLADVEIGVLPTLVLVRARTHGGPALDLAGAEVGEALRLDQVNALHDIVDLARRGLLLGRRGLYPPDPRTLPAFLGQDALTFVAGLPLLLATDAEAVRARVSRRTPVRLVGGALVIVPALLGAGSGWPRSWPRWPRGPRPAASSGWCGPWTWIGRCASPWWG